MSESCRIVGPYFPAGEADWECRTHGIRAELRDWTRWGASDLRRDELRCPLEGS